MAKHVYLIVLISFIFTYNVYASGKDNSLMPNTILHIGLNIGVEYLTHTEENTAIETFGNLVGGTIKGFYDNFGLGVTFNRPIHDNKENVGGSFKSTFSLYTLDFLYNFSNNPNQVTYIAGLIGRGNEDYYVTINGEEFEGNIESDLYGFGIGGFSSRKKSFSFGGELRYLLAPDSSNAEGNLLFYFTLGYIF